MSKIQIFVSHRTDLNSKVIDNPMYVPVRCGAVFDPENASGLLGDDTGDNISHKKKNLSEFTVQYWAWKNAEADYYGLCHYRRFLSFAERKYPINAVGMVDAFYLGDKQAAGFGFLDQNRMAQIIDGHDLIVSERATLRNYPTPIGSVKTVRQLWDAHDGLFITSEAIDEMFRLIDQYSPEYSISAREYFDGGYHRGYNCFVMRKELFFRMCEFQFPIIFEMEKWLQTKPYRDDLPRLPGYIGEMLYGVFIHHIMTREDWNVKEVQLVLFRNTVSVENRWQFMMMYVRYFISTMVWKLADIIFPVGTKRRVTVKYIWHKLKKR